MTAPGPSLRTSLVLLGVGIAIAIAGGVGTGVTFARSRFTTPVIALPAHLHRHLDAGSYQIYQLVGSTRDNSGFPVAPHPFASLTPPDVSIRSTAGEPVAVGPTGDITETLTRGRSVYSAALRFDVAADGDYAIDIASSPAGEAVIITRTIGDTFRQAAPWLGALGGGALLGFVGVVMLIVGIVRRNRASRQVGAGYVPMAPYAGGPPPAWYPDPSGSGRQRWWDGTRWTDHLT